VARRPKVRSRRSKVALNIARGSGTAGKEEPIAAVPALGPISWVALTILLAAAGYFAVKNALR
jgi:hypothetical protein